MTENNGAQPKPKIPDIFRAPVMAQDAREQAAEYLGFARGVDITGSNGEVFEIPNPSYLDDDAQARYNAFLMERETWDRYPDVFADEARKALTDKVKEVLGEQLTADGGSDVDELSASVTDVFAEYAVANAEALVLGGALKVPHRKDDVLVEPYNTQVMKAIFGERYERAVAAGIRSNEVSVYWSAMSQFVTEKVEADSKSAVRPGDLVPVPDGDRVRSEPLPPAQHPGVASGDDEQPRAAVTAGAPA